MTDQPHHREADHLPFDPAGPLPGTEYSLIRAHCWASLATLFVSLLFGILVAIKFNAPEFAGSSPAMTWGRVRYDHTQGIFFGWLGNAFLMFLYHAVPRLANRPVLSKGLGWFLFAIWNFAIVLPGWALVMAGYSQPLEWAEFPLVVDAFVVLSLFLSVLQFALPLLRARLSQLYVSGWYILGALIFTLLAYPIGNIVPELVPGAQGAAFSGLWIHDAIGLYVTPLAVAIAYFVIPAITGRPIYSHFLSMVGFWLLFFVYPLNGTHHFVFSAIPMTAQQSAIVASVYLGMDVVLVVTNLLLSLRGAHDQVREEMSLRFVRMGVILYLIVSLQGSVQALMPINKLIHFSDWVIGHSHLAMLGFASFTAIGGITHVWQQLPCVRFNRRSLAWCYWLLLSGLIVMVSTLTVAGLVEAHLWQSPLPWLDSVRQAQSYWWVRLFSAVPIVGAVIMLVHTLSTGPKTSSAPSSSSLTPTVSGTAKETAGSLPISAPAHGWLNMTFLSAFVAGVGFFVLSFAALAILPGLAMQKEIDRTRPAAMSALTESEEKGRKIYAREGCAYCHTQQVRSVEADIERFGAPTRAWETQYDYPHLWGTRRVGPDLARESGIRSDDWQLTHLYNARLIVKDSVMPPYPWLFQGAPGKPTQEARDLLAYLKTLGRERQLAGFGSQQVPAYCTCPEEVKQLETTPTPINASPSMALRSAPYTVLEAPAGSLQTEAYVQRGAALFAHNCATCHGLNGKGDGVAAASLFPAPADLTVKTISRSRLGFVLFNGVYGSSMPAWRDLPVRDLQALQAYLMSIEPAVTEAPSHPPASNAPTTTAASADIATKELFNQNCATCHGTTGDGAGAVASNLAPTPSSFKDDRPTEQYAYKAITEGVPGTSMPNWNDRLTEQQRQALASYVHNLYSVN